MSSGRRSSCYFLRSRPQSKKPRSNGSNSKRRSATMRKAKKPTAPKLGKELTAAEVQERRAEAFFQMEEPLRNCSDRAEIVGELLRAGRQDLRTHLPARGNARRLDGRASQGGFHSRAKVTRPPRAPAVTRSAPGSPQTPCNNG